MRDTKAPTLRCRLRAFNVKVMQSPTTMQENYLDCGWLRTGGRPFSGQNLAPTTVVRVAHSALIIPATTSKVWGFGLSVGWAAALIPDHVKSSSDHLNFSFSPTTNFRLKGKWSGMSHKDPLLRLLTLPQECVTKLHALPHRQRKQPAHKTMQHAEVSPDCAKSR